MTDQDDKFDPIQMAHELEQAEAALEDLAKLAAAYHTALIDNGIPELLAHDLIRDYMKSLRGAVNDG